MTRRQDKPENTGRREFIGQAVAFAASAGLAQGASSSAAPDTAPGSAEPIPKKPLGKTGLSVSAMGLGGFSLADAPTLDEAKRIVAEAIDAGLNFFDNAWEYHEGRSEEWMGGRSRENGIRSCS